MRCLVLLLIGILISCNNKADTRTPIPEVENKIFNSVLLSTLKFNVPLMGIEQLKSNYDNYTLLDAREIYEYKTSHLPGALYIGYDNPDWSLVETLSKEDTLVIYCSVGYRSEKIAGQFIEKGFTVFNLYGSIFEWVNHGYRIVDTSGDFTHRLHAFDRVWGTFISNDTIVKIY